MTDQERRIRPELRERARELRQPQTPAEQVLWAGLRDRRLDGLKFRRQHPIGPFVADFYCAECRLVIEIDGDTHLDQVEYDGARSEWLNERGYTVLRFTNREVQHQTRAVLEEIWACARGSAVTQGEGGDLNDRASTLTPNPSPSEGEGSRTLPPSPSEGDDSPGTQWSGGPG